MDGFSFFGRPPLLSGEPFIIHIRAATIALAVGRLGIALLAVLAGIGAYFLGALINLQL
jgi:hypothetical protein